VNTGKPQGEIPERMTGKTFSDPEYLAPQVQLSRGSDVIQNE
jgi:hypothetical protein